jgi:anti-sigma regulatory factor (Ser/Thr protein kinase)
MSQLIIPAHTGAGAIARRAVSRWLEEHPRLDDALLALTELVNNAVLHGGLEPGEDLTITMKAERDGIRLTVRHTGVLFDARHTSSPNRDAGASRGLAIVEMIADSWGVDSEGSEVTAWFEVGRE